MLLFDVTDNADEIQQNQYIPGVNPQIYLFGLKSGPYGFLLSSLLKL